MQSDMGVKKLFGKLHLWLGIITGPVIFILGVTGAIYCFAPELQDLQPYRCVEEENKAFLPPSKIKLIAEARLPGKSPQRIYYAARDRAVMVLFSKKDAYTYSVFINPYNGAVLKVRNNDRDFLSVVLQIHRTLLIPYGHEIIRWSTVIFIFMLISGLILWMPRKKRNIKQGFKIMWNAGPKRLNYDLHKVLGFYITWMVIFTALTGLMFAFENFASFVYRQTGFENSIVQNKPPVTDTTLKGNDNLNAIDLVWHQITPDLYKKYSAAMFVLPALPNAPILLRANPDKQALYKTDFRYFDQFSGNEIKGAYVWGKFSDARTTADYIKRMNYDIHTGAIFGLPGRIALFFVALIVASLPVTGFYFWWGRKVKRKHIKQ